MPVNCQLRFITGRIREVRTTLVVACCLGGLWLSSAALAADPPAAQLDLPKKQEEVVKSAHNANIHFTYYPSKLGKDAPVIMLLHMKDSNRFVWKNGFADKLQAEGYAVVSVDLRGHGESKTGGAGAAPIAGGNANQPSDKTKGTRKASSGPKLRPSDYSAMADDLAAVKKDFLMKEHKAMRLNIAKLGVVGPEMGATIAASFANQDWNLRPFDDGPNPAARTPRGQDVKALVLISPQAAFEGMNTVRLLDMFKNPDGKIALLVCVGAGDAQQKDQAERIFKSLRPVKDDPKLYFKGYETKLRGTDLLGKDSIDLEQRMIVFFNRHLMKREDIPWQDRRPKYEREKN